VNYARSSLFGNRTLNLVHVENVAAALTFLATTKQLVDGEVYLVSDDDSRENQFRTAERLLMETLGIPDYALPPLPIPGWLLSGVLRVAGRSNTDPHRTYDDSKLMRLGFRKLAKLRDGIREFVLAEATYDAASMRGRATTSPEGVGSA
jgi:nucleoside-diphosphate-sugar epimerase